MSTTTPELRELHDDELQTRPEAPRMVARVIALVDGSEYKRRQAPIGIKITHRALGKDRRMPITNGYRNS